MSDFNGQISVKDFLIAEYDGKLSESELYECRKSIMDFARILSEVAEETNFQHDRYSSTNARATSI
jgi:hypothetical protein